MDIISFSDGTYSISGLTQKDLDDFAAMSSYSTTQGAYKYSEEYQFSFGNLDEVVSSYSQKLEEPSLVAGSGSIGFTATVYKK